MEIVTLILAVLGFLVLLVSTVWLIVVAFKESTLWGCGMFLPLIPLIFIVTHWNEAKKPFLYYLGGFAIMFLGAMGNPTLREAQDYATQRVEEDRAAQEELFRMPPPSAPPTRRPERAEDAGGDASTGDALDSIAPAEGARTAEDGGPPPPTLPPPAQPRAAAEEQPRRVVGPTVSSRGEPSPLERRVQVTPQNASRYVGYVLEIVTIEGQRQKVRLADVGPDRYTFNADGVRYSLPFGRIQELWVVNPD